MPEPWGEPSPWAPDDDPAPALIGTNNVSPGGGVEEAVQAAATVAYVPSMRFHPGDANAQFELRLLENGRSALLAYSSLDMLVAGCGEAQPWLAVRLEASSDLAELTRLCGADMALWDVNIAADARHGTADPEDTT